MLFSERESGLGWIGKRPRSHPIWRLVLERPLEFDADDVRRSLDPLLERARGGELTPVISLERLSGHPFSGGHDARQIADRLAAVVPEARVLVVVREQRSMIASTYKQFVKAGGAQTFAHFVEPRGKQNWRVPQFDFRHFEYHHLIRYYRSLFGADRVLVLPYEQLVGDPRAFVARIGDFAGRPLAAPLLDRLPYGRNLNPSPSALTVAALRRLNRFAPRNELNPAPIVELDAAERLADWMKAGDVLSRGPAAGLAARAEARLRSEVEQAVGTRYAASNRETAELAGLDLASYRWPV